MVAMTEETIDVSRILQDLGSARSGGQALFIGTVRDRSEGKQVERLEYTSYLPMARKMMAEIEEEIRTRWPVHNVIMIHRVGMLGVGEVAVVTAISAEHREEAFAACRYAIDRVKSVVPIWKKEYAVHGAVWVGGEGWRG